ncbi:NAD-dependent epimerase/dehydratase family protein [Paenibacillus sp. LMG 31461]|uniref:NAD-dependent epimerase/dehydratase family protein n=1 Tax=Paenibacillus plantarum TaxID=2654975 RepID=A0ABX1XD32_9BACL|nr:GDP-mannose 4,6-dehydratase [Paenibacillus plantarum]NOU66234.1 NAD-dependent epimerase/dehydratase family protein [Paenibacillus plantarum]
MRVLVTGANGFVGRHLIHALVKREHEVFAGTRSKEVIFGGQIMSGLLDILDVDSLSSIISKFKPDVIVHLAAQSMVKEAWKQPEYTLRTNVIGTINLLEAIRILSPETKLISIGSSEEYGLSSKYESILTENVPCLPQNPYATSKHAAGQLAMQFANKENLNVIHVRPFNHFGPGQKEGFVISDFASQIIKIEKNLSSTKLRVGNLEAKRDFTHVADVVRAYIMLLEQNVANGYYNVCSGIPRKIDDILKTLISMSSKSIEIELDPNKLVPSEVPSFAGSYEKIKEAVGWTPKIDISDGIHETLEWWRTNKD